MKIIEALQQDLFRMMGKPQTIQGVYQRMLLRILEPDNPAGFKSDTLCHSVTIDYAYKKGKPSDMIVFVGWGDRVYHSFVASFGGLIIADTMLDQNPTFDGKFYRVGDKELKWLWNRSVMNMKKDLKQWEGTKFLS